MATKTYKGQKQETKQPDGLVQKIVKGFKSSWNYRDSSWHPLWRDMQKLYDSERVYVGYNGISDTFVPMSYSTVETMVAATSGDKPLVEYIPTRPDQRTNTEVLNGLFSFYWDLDQWTPKLVHHNRGLFKLGTDVLYLYWNIDHPCMEVIPLKDFFCDPAAVFYGYQNASYMGYRFLSTKDKLKAEQVVDPETGELVPKYKNLDKIGNRDSGGGYETDKEDKDMHQGSTLGKEDQADEIEVLCYWTLDEKIYVGNRQEIIYQGTNDFKQRQQFLGVQNPTGLYPFVIDSFAPDESQLYGRSVLQAIAKHQELLNDLTNQNVDAVSWALDPEMELDPMYQSYMEKMRTATGNIYPFKPGSYVPVQKPIVPSNAFNERMNIKNEIREATAIDEVIKGIAARGDTTATQVKAQVASSGRRFDLIISMLENGGYYTLAKLVFQMVQHYVTEPTMFRVIGREGADWQTFDPEQFKGDYEPRIKLKATLDNENKLKMRDVKEMYTALLGSPFVNQEALTRFVIQKGFELEPDEAKDLVLSEEEAAKKAASEMGGKGTEKPPTELINYKDAPPDVKAQMEAAAGMEPSVTHETSMDSHLVENAATQQQGLADAHANAVPDPMVTPANPMGQPPVGQVSGGE